MTHEEFRNTVTDLLNKYLETNQDEGRKVVANLFALSTLFGGTINIFQQIGGNTSGVDELLDKLKQQVFIAATMMRDEDR